MKTLFFPKRQLSTRHFKDPVKIDMATNTMVGVDPIPLDYSCAYFADEDLEIRYTEKGETKLLKANKGDVIFVFYDYDYIKNKIVVIKNTAIRENVASFLAMRAAEQAKKESYAKTCKDCCESCR
ncbi:hypothetical protein [uncultured phage cr130_1]|uniref:Uncharacterized protein n=1 Tax=uncultured phage cr130_1 TaxID=2772092 RepID=A0A7M1RUU7_9CAUD|nr:hypothetical protein KNV59_gp44 [uncultured phage cr130_1]QOR57661.1 hypothetical protein [uncultured phage cr130_1]